MIGESPDPSANITSDDNGDNDHAYSIDVPSRMTGGTVKVVPTSASENQRVTLARQRL